MIIFQTLFVDVISGGLLQNLFLRINFYVIYSESYTTVEDYGWLISFTQRDICNGQVCQVFLLSKVALVRFLEGFTEF